MGLSELCAIASREMSVSIQVQGSVLHHHTMCGYKRKWNCFASSPSFFVVWVWGWIMVRRSGHDWVTELNWTELGMGYGKNSQSNIYSQSNAFVVQPLSHVRLLVTPWTTVFQASLFSTVSWSLLKLMSMPSNHVTLCCPLLPLPSILPSIRVFSNESALHIRWPKYWSFKISISPSNEIFRLDFL